LSHFCIHSISFSTFHDTFIDVPQLNSTFLNIPQFDPIFLDFPSRAIASISSATFCAPYLDFTRDFSTFPDLAEAASLLDSLNIFLYFQQIFARLTSADFSPSRSLSLLCNFSIRMGLFIKNYHSHQKRPLVRLLGRWFPQMSSRALVNVTLILIES
jgi:hypothetical protein